jgi:hypothetical protein
MKILKKLLFVEFQRVLYITRYEYVILCILRTQFLSRMCSNKPCLLACNAGFSVCADCGCSYGVKDLSAVTKFTRGSIKE